MTEAVGDHDYINFSWGRQLVSAYTGLTFHEVGQLDYGTFLLWRRDAYIAGLNRTEAGRQYLAECWRMEQTQPDRRKLRRYFGKE